MKLCGPYLGIFIQTQSLATASRSDRYDDISNSIRRVSLSLTIRISNCTVFVIRIGSAVPRRRFHLPQELSNYSIFSVISLFVATNNSADCRKRIAMLSTGPYV